MTNEEAINMIRYLRLSADCYKCQYEDRCMFQCDEAEKAAIAAIESQSKICDTCARWKPFADAMECTRDHCERGYDDYCPKWEDRNSGI